MNLENAKIIITGGSTGIGLETARMLISKGAKVVICARNEKEVMAAAKTVGAIGLTADVSKEESVKQLFKDALKALGGLDAVVNNAGIGHFSALTETTTENFTKVWETNVRGAFFVGRAAAQHFIEQDSGNIINISSSAGLKGFANGTAYCATKFAVTGMTECWRAELRPHNIRVMQVNPSEVVTEFGSKNGYEHKNIDSKLKPTEIAHAITAMLEMNDVGFITDLSVWATNPK